MPARRRTPKATFQAPILEPRKRRESRRVHRGAVKIRVRASPELY